MELKPTKLPDHESGFDTIDFQDIHLWDYVNIVLKRAYVALAIFIAVFVLAATYSWTRTPKYTAKSNILLEAKGVDLTDIEGPFTAEATTGKNSEFVPTQMKLLVSRPVLEQVLHQTGLNQTEEFLNSSDPVAHLSRMVKVLRARNSMLLDVKVERANPEEAARIVNNVVNAYILETRRRRSGISDQGLIDLDSKTVELRKSLDDATQAVNDFLSTHNIISFKDATELINDRIRGLNDSLWRSEPIRLKLRAEVEAAEKALAEGRSIESLPFVIESSMVSQLKLDLAQKGVEEAELRERLGDNHPQLKSLESERRALQNQIALFSVAALESLRIQNIQAEKEAQLLRQAITEHGDEIKRFNDLSTEYEFLSRAKANANASYIRILKRIEDVRTNMIDGQGDQVFVISKATAPQDPSSPDHLKNIILGALLGIILSIGACFFLEYMDTSVKTMDEAQEIFGSRTLGTIPMAGNFDAGKKSYDLITAEDPKSNLAEAFRMIRSSLQFANEGKPLRHLVVTSALPREGKSITSINIALSYAQANKKVLLIDADMRKPRMHTAFSVPNNDGFSILLQSQNTGALLDELIIKTKFDNLSILPAGPIPPNPAELLDSEFMAKFIKEVEARFDIVIFDSPPSTHLADSMIIAKYVDAMAVVLRILSTPRPAARFLAYNLNASHANLLGLICNNVDTPSSRYGYGKYGYGQYGVSGEYYGVETKRETRKNKKKARADQPAEEPIDTR